MTKYADPQVCPDCRSSIEFGAPSCPHCDLPLTGNTAQLLFVTLSRADELVAQLRLPAAPAAAPYPSYPAARPATPAPAERRPALNAASVPRILLGLGALCLLVAALVFLAVAWSALGVGGRTAVLVLLTASAAGLTAWLARKALRAGAESFTAVALGLLTLDLFGADSSGWFGDLSSSQFVIVLGACLALAGAATAVAALASPVERLAVAELGSALGLQLAVVGVLSGEWIDYSAGYVGAVVVSALVAAAAWRYRLVFLSFATAAAAGLWWLALLTGGAATALEDPTFTAMWAQAGVWPMLVAAALVALPSAIDRLPGQLRIAALAVGVSVLALAIGLTADGNSLTTVATTSLGILAVATLVAWLAPGNWGWSAIGALVGAAVPVVLTWATLTTEAVGRLVAEPWTLSASSTVSGLPPEASPLLVLPCAVLLTAATASAWRLTRPSSTTWSSARSALGSPAIALLTVCVATTTALYPSPRWSVVTVLLAGTVLAWLLAGRRVTGRVVAAVLGALSLAAALPSSWRTLAVLAATTALAAADDVRHRDDRWQVAPATTIVLLAGLLWTGGHVLDVGDEWAAAAVIAVTLTLSAWRPIAGYELAAAAVAVTAIGAGSPDATWLAVHLTLSGALVSISSLLHRRRDLGLIGAALLFLATWVRLADLGVTTVEAYTMPLALALVAFGLYRMRRDQAGSLMSLTPGLGLLVVPSLLVALVEPVSLRALLVGLGCAALVGAGASLRWSAPLVVGAAGGLMLVLREAAYAQLLQQWVVIGLVGVLLTVAGVTWESRVRELRLATGYLRRLR